MLSQNFEDGEHPIAYASRIMAPRETRHAIIEKEALAMQWAINYFRHYLIGRKFTVQTDHKPLLSLRTSKDQNTRLTKIGLRLQGYDFDIEFRPGVKNQNADLLSRYPVIPLPTKAGKGTEDSSTFRNPATVAALAQVLALDGRSPSQLVSEEPPDTDISTSSDSTVGPSISECENVARVWAHLQEYQDEDEYCQQWIRFIHHGEFPDDDREAREMALQQGQFCMQGGILYRIVDGREQVVVPEALKPIVLYQCHTGTGGH